MAFGHDCGMPSAVACHGATVHWPPQDGQHKAMACGTLVLHLGEQAAEGQTARLNLPSHQVVAREAC